MYGLWLWLLQLCSCDTIHKHEGLAQAASVRAQCIVNSTKDKKTVGYFYSMSPDKMYQEADISMICDGNAKLSRSIWYCHRDTTTDLFVFQFAEAVPDICLFLKPKIEGKMGAIFKNSHWNRGLCLLVFQVKTIAQGEKSIPNINNKGKCLLMKVCSLTASAQTAGHWQ